MSETATSVPDWALGEPPAGRVLRAADARVVPLELPDLDRPHPATAPTLGAARPPVWSAGYQDGYAEGLSTGHAEGLARGEAEGTAKVARSALAAIDALRVEVAAAMRAEEEELARVERDALDLALDMAEMVLGHHVATCDDPGTEALTRAMGAVGSSGSMVAHLHPDDLELMGAEIPRSNPDLELVADPGVGRGGCVLEAGPCRVDATLGSALGRLRRILTPEGDHSGVSP
jgi:flagellar assembly protein FliH